MYTDEMYHAAYSILSVRAEQLDEDELYHHGILGQKWGVRRYQNEDGSVTPAGAKRYYINGVDESGGLTKAGQKWKNGQNKPEKSKKKLIKSPAERRKEKINRIYEQDKEKYGFKDARGTIKKRYKEYYSSDFIDRKVKNFMSLGKYDKAVRDRLYWQELESAKASAQMNPAVYMNTQATAIAGTLAAGVAYNKVKDPAFQARANAYYREFQAETRQRKEERQYAKSEEKARKQREKDYVDVDWRQID